MLMLMREHFLEFVQPNLPTQYVNFKMKQKRIITLNNDVIY